MKLLKTITVILSAILIALALRYPFVSSIAVAIWFAVGIASYCLFFFLFHKRTMKDWGMGDTAVCILFAFIGPISLLVILPPKSPRLHHR